VFLMLLTGDVGKQMTAREVIERHEEKLLMLGPVLERLQHELLGMLIDREFQILVDARKLPLPPMELQGQPLEVEYISVLASAQRMMGMQVLSQFVGFVAPLGQLNPAVFDKVDFDQMVDEASQALGVPGSVVIDDETVAMVRNERLQRQQAQQQAQAAMSVTQGAKNLGQASTAQGTALRAMYDGQVQTPA